VWSAAAEESRARPLNNAKERNIMLALKKNWGDGKEA
jgi:hypothetical protein